ncbi:MAG: hypothetical protein RL625_1587 [Gemmatimonadota bacterium]
MTHTQRPSSQAVRVETFTGLRVFRTEGKAARQVPVPVGEKPGILLVILALAGEAGIPRSTIRSLLWPETSDGNGSNSLRQALFRLRRALGLDAIEDRAGRLYLRLPVSIDVVDAAQRLERGDLPGALDLMTTPFGQTLDVAGPALRDWLERYRSQLDERLESLIRASWSGQASGAVLAMLHSAIPIVRRLLPTSVDLLWIQLELDARQGESAAFDRHLQELRALQRGAPTLPADTQRLAELRQRLAAGAAAPHLRPPSLHEDALRAIQQRLADAKREGGVIWVSGPTGVGRSHLLRELAFRSGTGGFRAALVGPDAPPLGLPPSCCRDLAVALSALRGAAGHDPRHGPIIERLTRGAVHPVLSEAVEAILDLAIAITAEGPLVLLIDDGHQYEGRELGALLAALDEQRPPALVAVVAVPTPSLPTRLTSPALILDPITPLRVRQMVDELARLPEAPWSDALIDGLRAASDGIPRRVLYILTTLHREGVLQERNGSWALGSTAEGLRTRLQQLATHGTTS